MAKLPISDEAVEAALDAVPVSDKISGGVKVRAWLGRPPEQNAIIMRAALEAAYPHIAPHGIGVKGLVWTKEYESGGYVTEQADGCDIYRYDVWYFNDQAGAKWRCYTDADVDGDQEAASVETAKAACQSHFETRILSALQRNPEGAVEPTAQEAVMHHLQEALRAAVPAGLFLKITVEAAPISKSSEHPNDH